VFVKATRVLLHGLLLAAAWFVRIQPLRKEELALMTALISDSVWIREHTSLLLRIS